MSTPGGDKPDLPDFSDFDLPTDGLPPVDDASLPDLPSDDLMPAPEPLDEVELPDLSIEETPTSSKTSTEGAEADTPVESVPAFAVGQEDEAPAAEDGKTKKKAPKRKKEKKEPAGDGQGVFQRLGKTSPYTVMLGLSVIALVIAVVCLVMELAQFNYDVKAQEAKQRAALTAPLHSAPARMTAAA